MTRERRADPSDALETFLEALPFLGRGELLAITAAHERADAVGLAAARASARGLAARLRRVNDLQRLHGSIAQWASSDMARSSAFTLGGFVDPILVDLRTQSVPALVDAATALLLGTALDGGARTTLLEGWTAVTPSRN